MKWIPVGITGTGLLFCFVLYLNLFFGTNYPSVITENQYLVSVLVMSFTTDFIACLIGNITCKLFNRLNKQSY